MYVVISENFDKNVKFKNIEAVKRLFKNELNMDLVFHNDLGKYVFDGHNFYQKYTLEDTCFIALSDLLESGKIELSFDPGEEESSWEVVITESYAYVLTDKYNYNGEFDLEILKASKKEDRETIKEEVLKDITEDYQSKVKMINDAVEEVK
jgi:hypothetical protein